MLQRQIRVDLFQLHILAFQLTQPLELRECVPPYRDFHWYSLAGAMPSFLATSAVLHGKLYFKAVQIQGRVTVRNS